MGWLWITQSDLAYLYTRIETLRANQILILSKLNRVLTKEDTLMSDLDDKLAALEAAQAANHAAIANELQQLATAIANQAPDLTPAVNRLISLTSAVQADTAALNADDPQPPTPVNPPVDTPPDTPPASAKSSKK
jgi:transglutaminase/protease-like cytokinesis protein 3